MFASGRRRMFDYTSSYILAFILGAVCYIIAITIISIYLVKKIKAGLTAGLS